jgi:hypothetical protein
MAEKDSLFKSKVKHSGVFDFKELYRILYEWQIDQNYDMNEKSYKENIGAGGAKELEIEWEASRKVSDYFRFQIDSKWRIIGMTSVEVEIDGVKQKLNKGQLEIEFKCTLIKDYEDRWTKSPLFKFLRTLYDKYLIKERTEQFEGKLIGEMEELVGQCKAFLALTGRR